MKLALVLIGVVMASATPVAAGPARGLLGGGVVVASDTFVDAGLAGEAAVALPSTPLSIRVLGGLGGISDGAGNGTFTRLVGGVEASACSSRGLCWFAGLDAGFQTQAWESHDDPLMAEDHRGVLVGPRFGFDAGGETVRFRASLDLLAYRHQSSVADTRWESSRGLTLSLVRRL